jgi:hypothetical protein
MKIGILSDVHDALPHLHAALDGLQQADALLVAGDLCSPFVLPLLADGFRHGPIHVVFGNNDGDRFRMERLAADLDAVRLHGEAFVGTVGATTVAMAHFPEIGRHLDPRDAKLIVYGHDHRLRVERREGGWTLDPGSLLGYDPADRRFVPPSFLIYDEQDDRVDVIELRHEGGAEPPRPRVVPRAEHA